MPTDLALAVHKRSMLERRKAADVSVVLACVILALLNVILVFASPTFAQAMAWSGQY
jgi:hypothetical protein